MKIQRAKGLSEILQKHSGRDAFGHVSVRHQGGRHKRFYRAIDWKRDKDGVAARVLSIEYDPNRTADIALLQYSDGDKRYILAPVGLTVGATLMSGALTDVKPGNTLTLGNMPIGTAVHSVELQPGTGAKMIRSAGSAATVLALDGNVVHLKLPSGEVRKFDWMCRATVGQVGNVEWRNRVIGKAGTSRHMGRRPEVRGVAQNPRTHPHGGGEGRSGIGRKSPMTKYGKKAVGKTRNKKKKSGKFIVRRRTK